MGYENKSSNCLGVLVCGRHYCLVKSYLGLGVCGMKVIIIIAIQPQYVVDIINGKKKLEIRKTCPKIFKHLKSYEGCSIEVYIYCTKKEFPEVVLYSQENMYGGYMEHIGNGKVVAKFTLNTVEEIKRKGCDIYTDTMFESTLLDKSCLELDTICHYLKHEEWQEKEIVVGYAWHIDNLVVFDKPKELSEFKPHYGYPTNHRLTRAPQSWCYAEV